MNTQLVYFMYFLFKFAHISTLNKCASGNKPGLGAMETAYIPHNHTLTV